MPSEALVQLRSACSQMAAMLVAIAVVLLAVQLYTPTKISIESDHPLPISLLMVDHNSPESIANTLESYRRIGLFDMVAEKLIYIQQVQNYNRAALQTIARMNFTRVLVSTENTYVHGALRELFDASTQPYVLLLEKDFAAVEDRRTTRSRLVDALLALQSDSELSVVRMKSRCRPGVPEFARQVIGNGNYAKLFDQTTPTHDLACQLPYWMEFDEIVALGRRYNVSDDDWIQRHPQHPQLWTFPNFYCHWTNQAPLFRRNWFVLNVRPALDGQPAQDNHYQRHHMLEVACRYGYAGCRWPQIDKHRTAIGPGVFSHRDLDKYPYDFAAEELAAQSRCSADSSLFAISAEL